MNKVLNFPMSFINSYINFTNKFLSLPMTCIDSYGPKNKKP